MSRFEPGNNQAPTPEISMVTYPVPVPRPKNWFEKHWVLLLLGVGLCIVLAIVGLVGGLLVLVGNSEASKMAMERAAKSPGVQGQLGTPIRRGVFVTGNINVQAGGSGHAELNIPVSGPKGRGTIYLVADKRGGVWEFQSLSAIVGDKTVDLLEEQRSEAPRTGTF